MSNFSGEEKRKHPRAYRPLVVSYRRIDLKGQSSEVTQLRNIGQGGLAFISDVEFTPGENLELYIRLPLAEEAIQAKGKVLDSCKVSESLFCETRVQFTEISEEAKKQIVKAVQFIKNQMWRKHEEN